MFPFDDAIMEPIEIGTANIQDIDNHLLYRFCTNSINKGNERYIMVSLYLKKIGANG